MVGVWGGSEGGVVDVTGSTFVFGSGLTFVFGSGLGPGLSVGVEVDDSVPEVGSGFGLGISVGVIVVVGVGFGVGVDVLVGP